MNHVVSLILSFHVIFPRNHHVKSSDYLLGRQRWEIMSQGQPWQKLGTPYQKNKPVILAILEVEVGELRSTLCPRKKLETLSKKLKAKWTCDVAHVTQVIRALAS